MEAKGMIVGERIVEISGKRIHKGSVSGLNINIALEEVQKQGEFLELTYVYTANYEEGFGQLRIKGILLAKEEDKVANEIVDTWKKGKKIPDGYAETVLSAINYSGSANGTLLARVMGLTAPLIPPRIQISKKEGKEGAKK